MDNKTINKQEKKKSKEIEENKIINKNNINNIKDYFKTHPLIGLENIGNCQINSFLQCLSNIEKLTNYFKYSPYVEQMIKNNPKSLTSCFKIIIENLWPSNSNYQELKKRNDRFGGENTHYYIPNDLIEKYHSLFEPSINIYEYDKSPIIDVIHDELNIKKNSEFNNNNDVDQSNEQEMLKDFYKNFYNNHQSIISELFFHVEHSVLKCCECKKTAHFYNHSSLLKFRLEEVRKYKNELNNNMNQYNTFDDWTVNILDCFEYYQKVDIFEQENLICEKHMNYNYQRLLLNLPEILVIYLDRGRGLIYDVNIKFDEILDLNNYTKYGGVYELIGVISIFSSSKFHYIAFCKSPIDNKWYIYNDSLVSFIENIERNLSGTPYILFYQKIK